MSPGQFAAARAYRPQMSSRMSPGGMTRPANRATRSAERVQRLLDVPQGIGGESDRRRISGVALKALGGRARDRRVFAKTLFVIAHALQGARGRSALPWVRRCSSSASRLGRSADVPATAGSVLGHARALDELIELRLRQDCAAGGSGEAGDVVS